MVTTSPMKIFFSVGEPSGDLHGANLIRSLQKRDDSIEFVGYGGPGMAAAGCQLFVDLTEFAIMGFLPALRHLAYFWRLFRDADRYLATNDVDAVILIDYPGFNWWIARAAKKHGIPVYYYGVPQIWAWAGWRIRKMHRLVDYVLCKLPFEADWYNARGCQAHYVGHPYFDELSFRQLDVDFIADVSSKDGPLVTILPGSRTREVADNLKWFLEASQLIQQNTLDVRFAVASYNERHAEMARAIVRESNVDATVYAGRTPELIEAATCCLACSGSVSLELLYHTKPSVVLYFVGRVGYTIATRLFMKVRYITLVNLLACKDRFDTRSGLYEPGDPKHDMVPIPEFLTYSEKTEPIAAWITHWLNDDAARQQRVDQLAQLKQQFARAGASETAADFILEKLSSPSPARRSAA